MLAEISFAQAEFLWILLAWPLVQLLKKAYFKKFPSGKASSSKTVFYHTKIDEFMQAEMVAQPAKNTWTILSRILALTILLLLALALAKPQISQELPPETHQPPTRDLVIVLESSISFVLEDYLLEGQPASRLDVVKLVLDGFVKKLERSRFGLIIYAEKAYTLVPLTPDNQAARFSLQRLEPYLAGRQDMAMGEALGLALRELTEDETIQKRALVLVSDGLQAESSIGLPAIAALAKKLKTPIYTLGIGAGEKLTETNQAGLIYQPLETSSLKFLAQETGGEFYKISSTEDLDEILQNIEKMEAVNIVEQQEKRWIQRDLYYWLVAPALLLILIWGLITFGGRRWN